METPTDNRLLFFGDELVKKPEPRECTTGGLSLRLRLGRAEDSYESPSPARPCSATASISSAATFGSLMRAIALRARQAKSSLRPPPISKAAAKTIQTTALGSLSQFRPALVSSAKECRS